MKKIKRILIFLLFSVIIFTPLTAGAQIMVTDPISIGIQAIIKQISAANTVVQAAESKIQVELSALTYARQGEQLMNQIQELQQESSTLISSVNSIEGTVMMPAGELAGLNNALESDKQGMQNIIAQEKALGNPQMSQFLQNYNNEYGSSGLITAVNASPSAYWNAAGNQYSTAGTQSAQTAAYAQSVLNNSQNNRHLISQLGANVAAAHGQVAAEQANGQALVALTEEVNQLNKLEAQKAKLAAVQAGTTDSQGVAQTQNSATIGIAAPPVPPSNPAGSNGLFGNYPNVTFGR